MRAPRSRETLVRVAKMYYEKNLSQQEIAEELGTTRSNVSRILAVARDEGVVEIHIIEALERNVSLEAKMRERLGIRDARVLSSATEADPLRELGRMGANWFLETVRPGNRVALSWGSTLQALVDSVPTTDVGPVEFVQLVGGLSSLATKVSGQELVRELAGRLHCSYHYLHAPALFESRAALQALRGEGSIARALEAARGCDIAIVGIGAVGLDSSAEIIQALGLSASEQSAFDRSGAVGDICARYYNIDGQEVRSPVHDRVLAVDLDDLRAIPTVAAVAIGTPKGPSIAAAVRGGLLDVIICDESAAIAALGAFTADFGKS